MRIEPSQRAKEASFDLTPMIDVVLLLIIFFSLTSQFSETMLRPMDLPRQPGQPALPDDSAMSIVVDLEKDGVLRVLGREVSSAEVATMVREQMKGAAPGSDPLEVVVRADRMCASSHLETLARALADAGVLKWKLATAGPGGSS